MYKQLYRSIISTLSLVSILLASDSFIKNVETEINTAGDIISIDLKFNLNLENKSVSNIAQPIPQFEVRKLTNNEETKWKHETEYYYYSNNGTLTPIPLSLIDLEYRILPNKLTIPGFILGFLLVLVFQIEHLSIALLEPTLVGN